MVLKSGHDISWVIARATANMGVCEVASLFVAGTPKAQIGESRNRTLAGDLLHQQVALLVHRKGCEVCFDSPLLGQRVHLMVHGSLQGGQYVMNPIVITNKNWDVLYNPTHSYT